MSLFIALLILFILACLWYVVRTADLEDLFDFDAAEECKHKELDECISPDGLHCHHWYEGAACCSCGAEEMNETDKIAQGMQP